MAELHPAYELIARVENLWARDKKQAEDRADMIVRLLADAGLFRDAELRGGIVFLPEAPPESPSPTPVGTERRRKTVKPRA